MAATSRVFIVCFILAGLALHSCISDRELDDLFKSLTNEDKCGQMTQVVVGVLERDSNLDEPPNALDKDKMHYALKTKKVGSFLGLPYPYVMKIEKWQEIIRTIHNYSLNVEPKTIPIVYGLDSIHSASFIDGATAFPQPLSMAATFNVEIAERIGEIIAMEHRATGSPWNFSPVLDIGRQPLWSRLYETMGEDVHVILKMSSAYIRGHQGEGLVFKNTTKTATCLKHYVGYSFPFNGHDRTKTYIPENILREYHLPMFENGVKIGTPTVMINSGHVNGIPGHANYHLLTEVLKQEMKFEGFTVSDWEDIKRLHTRDRVAESYEDAVRIAVLAGIDMSMVPYDFSFFDHCVNLTKKDAKFVDRVNDAVKRILRVKNQMNLFDDPYPDPKTVANIDLDSSFQFNLEAARESIILAKNEDKTLPITNSARKTILITGPTANLVKTLNGGWSLGDDEAAYHKYGRKKYTVYEAINKTASNLHVVKYIEGANLTHLTNVNELVAEAAKPDVDYVILCVGEGVYSETPGNINDLSLDPNQVKLADALLASTNKPVILMYFGGRPRVIKPSIIDRVKAIIIGFLPGDRGGEAVADILFGHYVPNGRLPVTYPKAPNGFITYDHHPVEASEYEYLFEFGHGLSYTSFSYANLRLNSTRVKAPDGVLGMVDVTNTGTLAGKEVVLAYLNDEYSSTSRAKKQLKFFTKISLQPGETRTVSFEISLRQMSFVDIRSKLIAEPGAFNIFVANSSARFILEL